jgi:hypothetical protein
MKKFNFQKPTITSQNRRGKGLTSHDQRPYTNRPLPPPDLVDQTIKHLHENQTPNNVLPNSSPDLRDDVHLSAEQTTLPDGRLAQPLSDASLVLGARLRSLLHCTYRWGQPKSCGRGVCLSGERGI